MTTATATRALELAVLSGGGPLTLPSAYIDPTNLPTSADPDGYDVGDSTIGSLIVGMRRGGAGRRIRITYDTYDDGDEMTFETVLDGAVVSTAYTPSGGDTEQEAIEGFANAINGDAHPVAATTNGTALIVEATDPGDVSYRLSRTSGSTATMLADVDPWSCTVDVYGVANLGPYSTQPTAQQVLALSSWALLSTFTGDASFDIEGPSRILQLDLRNLDLIRPYVTAVSASAGDTAGTGVTFTTLDPTVAVGVYQGTS